MSKCVLYLVSDSLNFLAIQSIANFAISRFSDNEYTIVKIPNVKTSEKAHEIVLTAKSHESSIIVFSTSLIEVRDSFLLNALQQRVECLDLMAPILKTFGNTLRTPLVYHPPHSWQLDDEYFRKISAIEFAINNDDGKSLNSLQKADLILIGVSRTSKTPLSIYLAYHNYLVVNIPVVSETSVPKNIFKVSSQKIIGLTINPNRLNQIRTERNSTMGVKSNSQYADMNQIINELEFAEKIMKKLGCPIIDVSNKAVEETAEIIMKINNTKNKKT